MGAQGKTKTVNADFMHYCLKRVWMAEGASEEHGQAVADALLIGMRQGKLNQGLGVYEAIDLVNGTVYGLGAVLKRKFGTPTTMSNGAPNMSSASLINSACISTRATFFFPSSGRLIR